MSFDRGTLYLIPAAPKSAPGPVRLVWEDGGSVNVPVGKYKVKAYSIHQTHEDEEWTLDASGNKGPVFQVKAGKTARLKFTEKLGITFHAKLVKGKIRVGACFIGEPGMPLVIIKGKKLIPFEFKVYDARGREISGGSMAYG